MSRLTEDRLRELYAGCLHLVAERGFDNVTMDQIAEATKSSKATLYRQWGSKLALFIEALTCGSAVQEVAPDTGSLRGDLHELFTPQETDAKATDHSPELVGAILHAMKQNEELAEAVRTQILGPLNQRIDDVIAHAITRGEVAADSPALPHLHLVLVAPFVLHAALNAGETDETYIFSYIDGLVLPALGIL